MVTSGLPAFKVNTARVKDIASTVCKQLGLRQADLSVHFVGPKKMRTLNREYRGRDKSTDVLSFSQVYFAHPLKRNPSKPTILAQLLGDVVISVADARANAKKAGHPAEQEICLLLVHGILHLCGHDHENLKDEKKMFGLQSQLMELLKGGNASGVSAPAWRNLVRMKGRKLNGL